jgi:myo-inositol-1(or 4)-monophosphatase
LSTSHKQVAIKAAREAGAILRRNFATIPETHSKGKHDIVTNSDTQSEGCILKHIGRAFPEHSIWSEEAGRKLGNPDTLWIIDPLDGTANFVMGNPLFSVSIAFAKEGEVTLGVVIIPSTNQLYCAEKGKGSTLNGRNIHVSDQSDIQNSFVVLGQPYDESRLDSDMREIKRFVQSTKRTDIIHSPALNLCNLARGRIDAFIDPQCNSFDHAAGSLIAREAGAKLHNFGAKTWNIEGTGVIASNGVIHNSIMRLLSI